MKPETAYRYFSLSVLCLIVCGGIASPLSAADKKPAGKKTAAKVTYDDHVKPIFRSKCFACHNTSKKKGGLDLTTYTSLMQGGSSGEVIDPGNTEDSYLYSLVTHDSEPNMPPKSDKLAKASLETIRKWIAGGALENSGSKPIARKKTFALATQGSGTKRPAGPPPMPGRLSRQPVFRTARTTAVTALATSPWASLAAVAGQKQVFLYNTKTLSLVAVLPFPEGVAHVLKFSRNGSLLLAAGGKGSASGRVVVWNVLSGKRVIELGDELDAVLAADISSDHRYIALGGPQKLVRIYSTVTGRKLHEIKKHTGWIYAIEFSPDGVLLGTGDRNGGLFVWETDTAREYLSLRGHGSAVNGLSWRSDSNILASAGKDATVRLWEMQNGRQIKRWGAHGGGTASIEFTRDGRIVTCGRDRKTKLWDQNGKSLRTFSAFSDLALRVTHCDETNRVIAGDWTGTVRVWNAADGKQIGELSTNPPNLKDRLKAVEAKVSQQEAASKIAKAAYDKAQQAAAKVQANLNAAKKTLTDSQKNLKVYEAGGKSANALLVQLGKAIPALEKSVTAMQAVITPLAESVAKAQEALKKSGNDKSLATAVAQVKAQLDARNVAMANAKKLLATKKTVLAATKKKLVLSQKRIVAAKAAINTATKQIPALTAALKPASQNAVKAKIVADAAAKQLAEARTVQHSVQNAVKAEAVLKQLATRRVVFEKLAATAAAKQAAAVKKKSELDAAKRELAEIQKQAAAAAAVQKKAETALATAATSKQAVENSIKATETVRPLLKDALTKAQAAAKASGDKAVAVAVKQIQSSLTRKTAELVALKKGLPAKTSVLAGLQKPLDAAKKKSSSIQSQVTVVTKKTTAAGAAYSTSKKAADTAKASADAAQKQLQQMQLALAAIDKP